jgi:glyoxylase-like metal-dependent hydrolase (beta-lactamase superfamily II)
VENVDTRDRSRTARGGRELSEVAPDVFCVRTPLANWYLLRAGRDLTLVDAGYPAHAELVLASIAELGHDPRDVRAVLVTHAHADHVGGLAGFLRAVPDVPVLLDRAEVAHARREHLQQVATTTVLRHAWRPRVAAWAVPAVRHGGTADVRLPGAAAFPSPRPHPALDVPGAPVPVPTPGHTSGHSAFLLREHGVVLTGDALVTGHPLSGVRGPQLLTGFFHHDPAAAVSALDALAALPADVVAPGHGRPLRVPLDRAVREARARWTGPVAGPASPG